MPIRTAPTRRDGGVPTLCGKRSFPIFLHFWWKKSNPPPPPPPPSRFLSQLSAVFPPFRMCVGREGGRSEQTRKGSPRGATSGWPSGLILFKRGSLSWTAIFGPKFRQAVQVYTVQSLLLRLHAYMHFYVYVCNQSCVKVRRKCGPVGVWKACMILAVCLCPWGPQGCSLKGVSHQN